MTPPGPTSADAHLSGHFTCGRLLRFALPMVGTSLFTSVYSVVDGFFISNWAGKEAFAAVNLIFPYAMLLAAAGVMVGAGGNALVAMRLGAGRKREADRLFTAFLLLDAGLGAAISALGLALLRPAARALGAEGALLDGCVRYGRILLLANPLGMLQYSLQSFMVTAGRAKRNAAITVAAGLANALLDALFVAVLGWGLEGAAWASAAGMAVGALAPLRSFARGRSAIGFARPDWSPRPILRACANGASELASSLAVPVLATLYNVRLLRLAGADGVAAWGIASCLSFVFGAVFFGYSAATTSVVGYQAGAGNRAELRGILRRSLAMLLAGGAAAALAALALAAPLARAFAGYDPGLCALARHAFAVLALAFVPSGCNAFASAFLTGLGAAALSAVASFGRSFLVETATILLLPALFGLEGVWWSAPAAEALALALSFALLRAARRRFRSGARLW